MSVPRTFADLRILVVDDDSNSVDIMQKLIKFYGATVYAAVNGADGLEKARAHQPDFIISDLSMPVLDGWQMIKALKEDEQTAHIPIVALTAHAMVGDREKALAVGCHNYLSKPFAPQYVH